MVWECFYRSKIGYLWPLLEGRNNAIKYVEILEYTLGDVRMELSEMGINDPVFMQDNSPIHTAKLACAWFKENGWVVAKHPAYSPDMNPIEHVWAYMKCQLHKKYPHLLNMPGGPDVVKAALANALMEIWNSIPESLLESLYTSMPRHIVAVIKAEGWYTKY